MKYAELLEIMKKKYFDISGHHVVSSSESGIRLMVMADAMAKFGAELEERLKNSSLLTAKGKSLDKFGKDLGFNRELGRSRGKLKVFGCLNMEKPITIPQGAEFVLKGAHPFRFKTTEEGEIGAEKGFAELSVEAQVASAEYNLPAGVELLAEGVDGVLGALSVEDFEGGYEIESDESYRKRMLESFKEWQKLKG